jgi:hypothetical protein
VLNFLNTENRQFRINICGFLVIGILLLLIRMFTGEKSPMNAALEVGGSYALLSVYGALAAYYSFKYGKLPLVKIVVLGSIASYFFLLALGATMGGTENSTQSEKLWHMMLYFFLFASLGMLNAYLGIYVAIFNILIFVLALSEGSFTDPFVWVNILALLSIENPIFQWLVVLASALLGATNSFISAIE